MAWTTHCYRKRPKHRKPFPNPHIDDAALRRMQGRSQISVPDTIDTRVLLNKPNARKPLNAFQMTDNNNIMIASAMGIGCSAWEHLILGLIWQIIR
ncbi:hypothetical protein DFH29DRAFT_961969 [Suillus ampliporus]|nr:hypothetical protein DFH29DRAFT_961969 [Suillus ampliporus]